MRNSVIVLLGLICVLATAESIFSINKREIGVFSQLQGIDGSDFGKKLLDTIALQLKNKSPLGDISQLLKNIEVELTTQQNADDAKHSAAVRKCEETNRDYEKRISDATATIGQEIVSSAAYRESLNSFKLQQETYVTQERLLNEHQAKFQKDYDDDRNSHDKRVQQQQAVITALKQIIPELRKLQPDRNVKRALIELARIGRENPIGALLQVAMTLDKGALERVVQHLEKLKKSVEASLADDDKAQATTAENYKQMMEEFSKEKNNLKTALVRVGSDIESTQQKLDQSQRVLANAEQVQNMSREGKKQNQAKCDDDNARYQAAKVAR